jgi:hypothetical protein
MAFVCAEPAWAQSTDPIALNTVAPEAIVAGEIVVQFKPGTSIETRDQVLALVEGVFVRSLDSADVVVAKVPAGTETSAAESIAVDPNVVAAAPLIGEANASE